ncbi:2-polyprenyl-3-methyl-5-hydroxy-6-metoxy-1;4-benzoquinol methylase [Deinococcus geothermalis DSM 11300]|uniref:2-polyprenyl-3-methyl-5-hydroxy-6-metoxy-14-benzoquinol methylase n=2 Tax=Deinococcus geothermalis TaxID=68909 RepID=Q1J110_DEIGD|nr:2-polyprenyl-3-methyl-5-hydroxy-6-metoxy-1;4-benzoquinol methylase [Deinococcus geothermalis DSM 11300]
MPSIMNGVSDAHQNQETLKPEPRLTLAQRSNLWPLTAWGYSAWRAHSLTLLTGQPFSLEREAALFLALCRPRPGETWLDAGTSTGFYAGVLARAGCQVLAADLSPSMLAQARRRETHPDITWLLTNLEASGLPAGSFAGVTVGATLNETRRPARLLAELARLIQPGGQLWLMYVARTGGPLQWLLASPALGGLTFPDPAWVARQLPGFIRTDGLQVGPVVFERYLKAPCGAAAA